MNRGWEIMLVETVDVTYKIGELLYVAETNEEALEIMMAFIQYYRETANYLERTWQWIGTDWINPYTRSTFLNRELRYQLIERLEQDVFQYKKIVDKNCGESRYNEILHLANSICN